MKSGYKYALLMFQKGQQKSKAIGKFNYYLNLYCDFSIAFKGIISHARSEISNHILRTRRDNCGLKIIAGEGKMVNYWRKET